MDLNEHSATASQTDAAIEGNQTSPQRSPSDRRRALLEEIHALEQSGADPGKLRCLLKAVDAERVRHIEELLAQEEEQALPTALQAKQVCLEFTRCLQTAMSRPDLTVPEMLFLAKRHQRNHRELVNSLVREKESIERRLRPDVRRHRGPI